MLSVKAHMQEDLRRFTLFNFNYDGLVQFPLIQREKLVWRQNKIIYNGFMTHDNYFYLYYSLSLSEG